MTNELGHHMAQLAGDQTTLGAYRLGGRMPWAPGATVDLWIACPRGEGATGVPAPHVLYKRTRGDPTDSGSIYCPECRVELAEIRARGTAAPASPPPPRAVAVEAPPGPQAALPF